jgi:decaprenylphospho-beta-D-erythro-pentofuranosid-2-ulose 2-reductase
MARVLIIGATSAIAKECARIHASRGDELYLVARNADSLSEIREELSASVKGTESADLDETDRAEERIARAAECLGGIDIALIAHGDLGDQLASEADFEVARRTLQTNLLSVMALVIPLANLMEAQASGSIAVMSSVAAERGRPRNFTYASAKSAVNTYLQGVRSRLWASGVRVHILKLGPVDTPMTVDHEKNALFAKPRQVAEGIVRAIDLGKSEVYVPWYWQPIMAVIRHLPEPIFQRIPSISGR